MIIYTQDGDNLKAIVYIGHIYDVCIGIVRELKLRDWCEYCDTEFNGIPLRIYATSDPRDCAMIYNLKNELRRMK